MNLNKLIEIANAWQSESAVVFGMVFQFFLVPKKSLKIALTIIMSSFLVAIYIVPVIIDVLHIQSENIERLFYAISALLSMEILALILTFLPKYMSLKLKKLLEIEDATDKPSK